MAETNVLENECSKCGTTLKRALLTAVMQDVGVKCYPGALACPGGGEHDWFVPKTEVRRG